MTENGAPIERAVSIRFSFFLTAFFLSASLTRLLERPAGGTCV